MQATPTHPPLEHHFNHSEPLEQLSAVSSTHNHFGIIKIPSECIPQQIVNLDDAHLPALRAKYRICATLNHLVDDASGGNLQVHNTSDEIDNISRNENDNPNSTAIIPTELNNPTIVAVEDAPVPETVSPIPNQVPLFPLYTRPVFPNVSIRTSATRTSNGQSANQTSTTTLSTIPLVDKIRTVQPVIKNAVLPKPVNKTEPPTDKPKPKEAAPNLTGPTVITERGFIDSLVRVKNLGENYVALSLAVLRDANAAALSGSSQTIEGVHVIGVLCSIDSVEIIRPQSVDGTAPAGPITVCVTLTGMHRVAITGIVRRSVYDNITPNLTRVFVREIKERLYDSNSVICKALVMSIHNRITELVRVQHPTFTQQCVDHYRLMQRSPSDLADICASLLSAPPDRLQQILAELDVIERLKRVLMLLKTEADLSKLLSDKANPTGKRTGIRGGENNNDKFISDIKEQLQKLNVPKHAQKVIDEELEKLSSLDPLLNATEHYTCRNYLQWLVSVPWGVYTKDNLDLKNVATILDEDHHGLKEIKDRILEFIAVAALKGSLHGKILCFVGPPGVGKTSLGKSIARATGRKFFRFSVGGMSDVAEIKGHRRTYIGAMPGKLIQSLKVAKSENPVILIDEIDKLNRRYDGDPASALLEALDPQQNGSFLDHYLDVAVDLSKVLFICTANTLDTIPKPLLDRMEVIKLSGYLIEEKLAIAKTHLLPQLNNDTALKPDQIQIDDEALVNLIGNYCREAGVRSLQKHLEKIFRKVAYKIANGSATSVKVVAEELPHYVGKPIFQSDKLYTTPPPGVTTGLAFNTVGGALVCIEVVVVSMNQDTTSKPQGRLKATGKLGDVMKESIEIAYTFARNFTFQQKPDNKFFDMATLHIHFPEGAIAKDGPSAGCAIVTALISLMLNKVVSPDIAMTGEITLTGMVLPVGGIKEKIMAAKRSNIKTVILPELNKRDYDELAPQLKSDLNIRFVKHFKDVYDIVFN